MLSSLTVPGCGIVNKQDNYSQKTGINSSISTREKELTAKDAFKFAQDKGKNWASDSVFVSIHNYAGTKNQDGKADIWIAKFYSRARKKVLKITISENGSKISTDEVPMHSTVKAVKGNWINSDQAMKIAISRYEDKEFEDCWMSLLQGENVPEWNIKFRRKDKEPFWVEIDATTGKLIKTRTGY